MSDLFDIVKAGISNPEIFHLIELFEDNVGPDRLSDMIASIILDDIKLYTKRIQDEFQINKNKYPSLRFDPEDFLINEFKKCRVYFLPKEILQNLPVAKCWEDVDRVIFENNSIKHELNKIIGDDLSKWMKQSSSDKKKYLKEHIFKVPDRCNRVLTEYRKEKISEVNYASDNDYYLNKTVQKIDCELGFSFLSHSSKRLDSMECTKEVVNHFKDWVENNKGWSNIQKNSSRNKEKYVQSLIHLCAKSIIEENDLDFSCEPNNGNGPVDFKISRGNDKTVIELKLSSNPQYMHGYTDQILQYAKAEKTNNMVYILIDVGNPGRVSALKEKVTEDKLSGKIVPVVFIIDSNHQKSASKI